MRKIKSLHSKVLKKHKELQALLEELEKETAQYCEPYDRDGYALIDTIEFQPIDGLVICFGTDHIVTFQQVLRLIEEAKHENLLVTEEQLIKLSV